MCVGEGGAGDITIVLQLRLEQTVGPRVPDGMDNPRIMKTNNTSKGQVWYRSLLIALLAVVSLAAMPGCIVMAAGAGAGAVAYVRGELNATVDSDYNRVVTAAGQAIKELEFAKVSENKDALQAVLVARTALDKKVEIKIANPGNKLTTIKIRVGVFGDEQLSQAVLAKIKAGL